MSKADAQRAMREAKYARIRASGPTRREAAAGGASVAAATPAATPTATPAATRAPTKKPARDAAVASEGGERCGHKSMNGRSCTRAAGHPEKSHRYG